MCALRADASARGCAWPRLARTELIRTETRSDRFLDTANPQDDDSIRVANLDRSIQLLAVHCGVPHHLSRCSPRLVDCRWHVREFHPEGFRLRPHRLSKLK